MQSQLTERAPSFSGRAKVFMLGALGVGACYLCCAGPLLAAVAGTGTLAAFLECKEGLVGLAAAIVVGIGGYALWRWRQRTCAIPGKP